MSNIAPVDQLKEFVSHSEFLDHGALVLDLDGTALHESNGKIFIPDSVRRGVEAVNRLGRPIVLNTLRFPLSVMRTIGHDWYDITNRPVPAALLNGAHLGMIHRSVFGVLTFEEIESFPLTEEEIQTVVSGVRRLIESGMTDIAVFYYSKNWIQGETIWVPDNASVRAVERKYISSNLVFSSGLDRLEADMISIKTLMVFVLANESKDSRMAYQHADARGHFTHEGVSKLSGLDRIARTIGFSMDDSIGAGDAELDNFLSATGCAVRAGRHAGQYEAKACTIDVNGAYELGDLLTDSFTNDEAVKTAF